MNININIGINQGVININSVEFAEEFTKNTSGSAENAGNRNRNCEESFVVWEQEEVKKKAEEPNNCENGVVVGSYLKSKKSVDAECSVIYQYQENIEQIAEQILSEIKEVYTPKKKDSVFLSDIYAQLYNQYERGNGVSSYANKSNRMFYCGSFLAYEVNGKGEKRLIKANTCHVRLCPMCMWRRALKAYREMRIVYDCVQEEMKNGKFLFLTLTQRNVEADKLGKELDRILYGFMRLMQRKEIKRFCLGFVRSLEITYNKKTDTYHPHIHVLIHTTNGLYSGRNYLSKQDYIRLWREVLDLEYDPNIKIKRFKPKDENKVGKELAEICKYSVKPSDYIYVDDENLTKKITEILDRDLSGRRLLSYGGTIREARKKLLFSDEIVESDDIMVVEDVQADEQGYIELYKWHFGEEKYERLIGEEKESMLKYIENVRKVKCR